MTGKHVEGTERVIEPTATDSPSGEVAIPDGMPQEPDKFSKFLTDRQAEGTDPDTDPYQSIIEQILSAESPDEVLTPIEAHAAKDMIGVPLLLHSFDMNESDYDVGTPFYASMKVVNHSTGEPLVVNCGHKKVLAQLIKLDQFGKYPYRIMIREQGRSKKSGDPMLSLVKWEEG